VEFGGGYYFIAARDGRNTAACEIRLLRSALHKGFSL